MPALVPTALGIALAFLAAASYYYAWPPADLHAGALSLWVPGFSHDAPDEPLTIPEAHLTMQRHRTCSQEDCPRKAAAYCTLVEARHIKPDTGRAW